jgi:(R,R)-butanediol dehydrogenase/meso-butanediol dehydrogenase/diacetyl reductase
MEAVIFNGVGNPFTVQNVADPRPGPGQVLLRVDCCGICGSDVHMAEDPIFGIPNGAILGHEYSAQVVELGADVERLKIGDRVCVIPIASCGQCAACLSGDPAGCVHMQLHGGGYAQLTAVHERQCIPLPANVSAPHGALVEPLAVGLHGVLKAEMPPGARILVIGAGPIGLSVIFWARRLGAGPIAATAATVTRAEMAKGMGADVFLEPEDATPQGSAQALGGEPDIVFECVGKPGLMQKAMEHTRLRGTVIMLGLCTVPDTYQPFYAVNKEVRLQMANFYQIADFTRSVDALARGDTQPGAMITQTIGLRDVPDLVEQLKQRTHQCKVMIKPN